MRSDAEEMGQQDQIVITLHEEVDGDLQVRSVDLFAGALKLRLSTQGVYRVDEVFHREMADTIHTICHESNLAKQILSMPDALLRVRGLMIRGYTLLVNTMANGLRQFIIRLSRTLGNAFDLFQLKNISSDSMAALNPRTETQGLKDTGSDQLFNEMLSHIYLPLVNLNNFLRAALDGERAYNTTQLSNSVVHLKTKTEVLQFAFDRLISEVMLEKYTQPGSQRQISSN